jgi:hypothetical protein
LIAWLFVQKPKRVVETMTTNAEDLYWSVRHVSGAALSRSKHKN